MTTIHTSQFANAGFANGSIHSVQSLAYSWRSVVEQAGFTHFFVINGEVHFVTFNAPATQS